MFDKPGIKVGTRKWNTDPPLWNLQPSWGEIQVSYLWHHGVCVLCGRHEGCLTQTNRWGRRRYCQERWSLGWVMKDMSVGISQEAQRRKLTRRREPPVGKLLSREKVWRSRNRREESTAQGEKATIPWPVLERQESPRHGSLLSWIRPYSETLGSMKRIKKGSQPWALINLFHRVPNIEQTQREEEPS